ncbi:LysR substrate-binding domain-containing protein [Lipingzhangella sp. LS1_29]|uniref:LysR substrate-binding domain-containing protein n=1 Tax=Lipingzhangella rawalii TaxID=2055835 RepID=A0ABU2H3B4_9ACTN|nr:LysR substrate-binding domain-containing protein [Lipingzhangella rawalii]MDS1269786.1 LysR substrate-binding domain-containing protein [Lipingzhangella rawalii]
MIDHRLQMLRMIGHHGTVTAAAQALNYTPSTVSQQIKQLSRELGVPLLTHHGREIRLTPAARTLLRHADTLFAQWEQARAELDTHTDEITGTLGLCGFSTAASALLPPTMAALGERYPRLHTRVIEAEPTECYDLVLSSTADLAVVVVTPTTPPLSDPRFDQRHLIDDPLDLLVPLDHALAGRSEVALAEAATEPWIVARPGTTYHQLVMTACASAGFTPHIVHDANEWETGTALVARGFGVCLVSRLARWSDHHPVVRIPLRGDPTPTRRVLAVTSAGAATRRPLAYALEVLADTADTVITA